MDEFKQFAHYMRSRHGMWSKAVQRINPDNYKQNPEYQEWINQGKPKEYLKSQSYGTEVNNTDESQYGVLLNQPYEGLITLPTGQVSTMDWWNGLTVQEKINVIGYKLDDNIVTLANGKTYSSAYFGSLTPDARNNLITLAQPTTTGNNTGTIYGYSDEDIAKMASDLGVTSQEVRRRLAEGTVGAGQDTGEITPWQQAQLDFQKQQFEWGKTQAEIEAQNKRNELWTANQQAQEAQFWSGMANKQAQAGIDQNAIYEKAYEDARQSMLSSLSPTDWVQKYQVTNMTNPYTKSEPGTREQVDTMIQERRDISDAIKEMESQANDPNNPATLETMKNALAYLKSERDRLGSDIMGFKLGQIGGLSEVKRVADTVGTSYWDALNKSITYAQNPDSPEFADMSMEEKQAIGIAARTFMVAPAKVEEPTLNIPDWLQPAIGAGTTTKVTGVNATKWPSPVTPSGQYWNKLTPTQQAMFGSYATAQGSQNPNDLVSQMRMQTPRNLNLGKYWKSSRSYA